MRDAIIIGCGIIGTTVGLYLRKLGMDVLMLDAGRSDAGTIPSGGHLKPSWFGGMKKSEYEPAMKVLDDVWGLKEEKFKVWPTFIRATVYRVDTDIVVATPRTIATVTRFHNLDTSPIVVYKMHSKIGEIVEEPCRYLVVATGSWIEELVPEIKAKSKRGVSFRFSGHLKEPFINPWAPYQQIVAHQQGPSEIWIGDGSALLEKSWTDDRTKQCLTRCSKQLKGCSHLRTLTGLRPYCESGNDPCLFRRLGPRAFAATGAGKSGTISAGWVVRKILETI